ncbi:MAG: DUF6880 family protein [Acidimicrobiia bacterium]
MSGLPEVFDLAVVMELAGHRAYARGLGYQSDNRVEATEASANRVTAVVRGTMPYRVELWSEGEEPAWSCDCPVAEDGSFCKHAVAVALEMADPEVPRLRVAPAGPPAADGGETDLVGYVSGLDQARLVELVLAQAADDWRLRERLVAEAQAAAGDGPSIETWKRRIDGAFAPYGDFVSYHEAAGWAGDAGEVIDALTELCEAGHAAAVVLLAEHAHRRADAAVQYIDDSDGWLTDISYRLSELHLTACESARSDPVALARRLVELELTSELDGFHRAAATYAEVLGDEGLAEYRRRLEPAWVELGADDPDDDDDRTWIRDFALRNAMIGWALGTGDPDALIEVKQHDLRLPDDYLEVARILAAADRVDEAIDWARRGLANHADRFRQLTGLRDFLGELLRSEGEVDASVQLFWDAFVAAPSLVSYRRLLDEVADARDEWRARCIEVMREKLATQVGESHRFGSRPSDALIDVLMFEGDTDGAWDLSREYGCDGRKLMTLARAREVDHPGDAIDVYEPEVFALIGQKKNHAYKNAVELMARIERLAAAADEPERFHDVLLRARTEHRAKRNLKKLLDAKHWPDPRSAL